LTNVLLKFLSLIKLNCAKIPLIYNRYLIAINNIFHDIKSNKITIIFSCKRVKKNEKRIPPQHILNVNISVVKALWLKIDSSFILNKTGNSISRIGFSKRIF